MGLLLLCVVLVSSVYAGNDYLWGEVGDNDYKLAKDTVSKAFFVGLVQTKKYVFKQSVCRALVPLLLLLDLYIVLLSPQNNLDALTITAVKVTDKKKSHGATAVLVSGGPGSKGATIEFTSERGYGIKDVVEIWGR